MRNWLVFLVHSLLTLHQATSLKPREGERRQIHSGLSISRELCGDLADARRELEAVTRAWAQQQRPVALRPVDDEMPVRRVGVQADAGVEQLPAGARHHFLEDLPRRLVLLG